MAEIQGPRIDIHAIKYQVYEKGTNKPMGKPITLKGARRKVDRLDNAYGCYHYYYKKA